MRVGISAGWSAAARRNAVDGRLWNKVLALSAGKPFFTPHLVVLSTDGTKVRAVVDHNDYAHWLDQSDTSKQFPFPQPHADFAGAYCFNLNAAECLQSLNASKFTFLHDGTGCSLFLPHTRTSKAAFHVLAASNTFAATTNRGIGVAGQAGAGAHIQAFVGNGTQTVWNTLAGGNAAVNVPTWTEVYFRFADASSNWIVRSKTTITASGLATNTPSALTSAGAFVWGAASNLSIPFVGRVPGLFSFPALDASGRSTVLAFLATMGLT